MANAELNIFVGVVACAIVVGLGAGFCVGYGRSNGVEHSAVGPEPVIITTEGDGTEETGPVTTGTISVEELRHAMVAGNAGLQAGEKSSLGVKVMFVRILDGVWQRRSDGQQHAIFFERSDGLVRFYVPMVDGDTIAAANLLVLSQGEQRMQRFRDDCLLFAEVDYSQCAAGEPDDAGMEDFAVIFEGIADRDCFEKAWTKAARTNCELLGF